MSSENKPPTNERLLIKLIMPKQGTEKKVQSGGGKAKPFRPVDTTFRNSLAKQISAIHEALLPQVKRTGAAPVRVKLLTKAVAKSHRPEQLFSSETCPIVGAGRLGELFIKATPTGLTKLTQIIENNQSERIIKEISCIETIETVTPRYRRKGFESNEVLRKSPRGKDGFISRVRLFNFGNDHDQSKLVEDFEETCSHRGVYFKTSGYSLGSFTYGVECRSVDDIEALSKVVGVRSIVGMPLIKTIRPQMFNPKPLIKMPLRKEISGEIPVVVVVDSGISNQNPALETWVVGRESDVAHKYRNTDHGTFVAGLICWGSELNPTISNIDENPCAVFDLQVIPNGDPNKGETDFLKEQEFLISLETALKNHANEYKVWNLSLGLDAVCSLDEFSPFAEELDNLQEKYQVSFVISAGNFATPPLLDYPRSKSQLEAGRITTPADSVLGITVGSISHVDYKKSGPKEHQPSPFSRHGAGPNYVIKPDLVHYGGSCSTDLSHISGIRSVNGMSSAENLGTSFSAPLVSKILAQIYHQITPTPKPVLARALLTHHARDPQTQQRVQDGEENFFGFGLPSPVPYCLECKPYMSTLVFDDILRPGYFLEWDAFPYPTSLCRNGRYFGEIWMTVAFSPVRGSRWGSEYCETHIDAHFGVYRNQVSRKTRESKSIFRGLVPPEHKNPGILYESYQIEKLRKWAPVRTYYGNLGDNGERGEKWRLMVRLLTRHDIEDTPTYKPQPFSLIITISDPEKKAPVYDEMTRIIFNRFQAQNLSIRSGVRIREKL